MTEEINPQNNGQDQNSRIPLRCKKISNYLLIRTIGEGTFGKVKLGQHCPTKLNVAIKILDKSKIQDERDYERIEREIAILKKLRHKNIIQLYETIKSKRNIYLIMEYVDGKDLFDYISTKKRLDEATASNFYLQLISAIEYIHKIGVVHRDIKPENILLDKDHENITLVDFGLSNTYDQGNQIKTACGSPCYASPEMISGRPYFGLKTDIWSSGVVLYCMLCGTLPFDDDILGKLYEKINKGYFILPDYLSDEAKNLLLNVMNVDPEKRFNVEQIKNHSWFANRNYRLERGIFIGKDKIKIDRGIIEHCIEKLKEEENITAEKMIKHLQRNDCNNITTTYHLIEKYFREQERKNRRRRINDEKMVNNLMLSRNQEKNLSNSAVKRSQNNSNNVSIIKDTYKIENIVEQESSQNNNNERVITKKNDASNNILKELEKKQNNGSQNNIEKEIENLKSNFENKERKPVSRNNDLDLQNNNPNNISFAENDKADINLNDDLIKNKLINNFNKKNNQNNIANNNNLHHYKTVSVVNNNKNLNDISGEMHNYQNTDHSKNQENSSILNTNSVNHTNPNANTLHQSNPNIQLHNKNQNLKNSKFSPEEINNNNNNLIISNYIHKNPIENKNQAGFNLEDNNNNYQSTLIPLNQQQPLVVVINNTILSDNRKEEDLGKIKNNTFSAVSDNYNSTNNHDLNDKKRNFTQIKTDLTEEESNEKNILLMKNSENNSNNLKLNTFVNNIPIGKENNNHYLSNKISYNFGILDQAKKITLNSTFKHTSNTQETNKNTLLANYNNFIMNSKNKNSSANNSQIPSGNNKINPSFVNSSLNQSAFNNKDNSENTSLNKNLNAHNINNSKKPKNFENFNNYVLSESVKNKIFKNHFQDKYFQNEQNKSSEKKYNQLTNQDTNNKPASSNLIQKNKTSIDKELLSSNKFSTKPRIQNLSLKVSETKKEKDTKTINIDLNNRNFNSNKIEFIKINKVEKTNVTNTNAELNFHNNPNLNREIKNISINEKAQDSQLINSEVNCTKNPKMNLRTTFFSQLKNNENNIKKPNKAQNPNSYLSTLNDKDERHRNPNKQLTNTISKITENYYMNNLKQINNQDPKKIGAPSNLITKNINYNENSNSLNDKNPSPMKESSLSKNKNISKEKDATSVNNKLYLNNLVNKSVNVTDTNSSQLLANKLDKSKLSFAAKNNTNLNSLLKFGLTNNILSTSSKINLKKNILTASTASKHNISNLKNSQNFTNYISSNTKITHDNMKNSSIINLNQSKNSIINTKEATATKNLLNQSRNQISGLNNKFKNTNMNNFTSHINNESEDNHMQLTKDLAGNHTNNSFMNNKIKFNRVFNNIQSGVIDLSTPNKNATYDNPNSNDSIPNLLINNKLPRKSNTNNIINLSVNSNLLINKITNNSNMNHYLTNQNNNSRLNGLNSEYSIESGYSKNKFLTNASNYSSLNQRTISENTDNSQNTIINNKYANNGIFKSVKTFISNESGVRSESMNYSNLDSRGNSRSKSKASDKTTSTIFYYNNTNGYKSDASEQNLNFHNFSNNIRSGDDSDNTNSAINLKKFNKNSFNFNELKKKLQIKDLDNSTSFHNSSLNRSGNNNTIKEGNSFTDNLDCKIIDIKEDYDHSSNPSGNLNHVKSNTNNKYSINSIHNTNANNKKSVIELNKDESIKKNLLNQNRNIEFMRNKINESKMNLHKQYYENSNANSLSKGKINYDNGLANEKVNFLKYNFTNLKKYAKENSNSKSKLEKYK